MNLLPQASGMRPRVACEIAPQGVVGARSAEAAGPRAAVARVVLVAGAVAPGLRPGNVVDRVAVVAAVRRAMEQIEMKPNSRDADMTLVVPDAAVRVLLLEFDALPGKAVEALPLVRFRLKKLLPFDADEAMVSYQVMSSGRGLVRVLAVAMPRDVLAEYESVAREAGFEPGAVLPSTLAALAGVEGDEASLLVNANEMGVTTAIVRQGILLLHRSVDLQEHAGMTGVHVAGTSADAVLAGMPLGGLPMVDAEASAGEWAAQEAMPEHGRNPYADRAVDEEVVQDGYGVTAMPVPPMYDETPVQGLPEVGLSGEVAQAVSVAAAYFEDTLAMSPSWVLSAGPLGADGLGRILREQGVGGDGGLEVRELVTSAAMLSEAAIGTGVGAGNGAVPRAWLSSVMGALRG
jgi:type IV pilus assembly protein PilM